MLSPFAFHTAPAWPFSPGSSYIHLYPPLSLKIHIKRHWNSYVHTCSLPYGPLNGPIMEAVVSYPYVPLPVPLSPACIQNIWQILLTKCQGNRHWNCALSCSRKYIRVFHISLIKYIWRIFDHSCTNPAHFRHNEMPNFFQCLFLWCMASVGYKVILFASDSNHEPFSKNKWS